jgi:hypothetical protein
MRRCWIIFFRSFVLGSSRTAENLSLPRPPQSLSKLYFLLYFYFPLYPLTRMFLAAVPCLCSCNHVKRCFACRLLFDILYNYLIINLYTFLNIFSFVYLHFCIHLLNSLNEKCSWTSSGRR